MRLLSALAAVIATTSSISAVAKTVWPNGARAAIVLTYDDALGSQLTNAIPVLDAVNFKATFFLSNVRGPDVARWKAVATNGHELGNHTIFHACAAADIPADPRYTTEAYTPASMIREILQANVFLTALDGKDRHGFATPCGERLAGGEDYIESLRGSGLVTYVRGVSETAGDLRADFSKLDPMRVPARGFADGTTSTQLIDFARDAEADGGMAVYLFHGIGGDYLQVSDTAHRDFIAWLAAHRNEVWVTTLQEALDWAKTHPG